jgi:hypothetical protein
MDTSLHRPKPISKRRRSIPKEANDDDKENQVNFVPQKSGLYDNMY